MYLMYGLAERNSKQDAYVDRFPNRHLPNKKTFQRLHERLRDTGSFKKWMMNLLASELLILNYIEENNGNSIQRIAENVRHVTVWRVLGNQHLYPYHVQHTSTYRRWFSSWILCTSYRSLSSIDIFYLLCYSDEATFTKDEILIFIIFIIGLKTSTCYSL